MLTKLKLLPTATADKAARSKMHSAATYEEETSLSDLIRSKHDAGGVVVARRGRL